MSNFCPTTLIFSEETALLHVQSVQTLILLLYAAASSYLLNSKSILFRYVHIMLLVYSSANMIICINVFMFRCLMTGRGALHAGLLTRTLLQHYCQQNPVPVSWLRKPEQSGSIVVGLASKYSFNLDLVCLIVDVLRFISQLVFGVSFQGTVQLRKLKRTRFLTLACNHCFFCWFWPTTAVGTITGRILTDRPCCLLQIQKVSDLLLLLAFF